MCATNAAEVAIDVAKFEVAVSAINSFTVRFRELKLLNCLVSLFLRGIDRLYPAKDIHALRFPKCNKSMKIQFSANLSPSRR